MNKRLLIVAAVGVAALLYFKKSSAATSTAGAAQPAGGSMANILAGLIGNATPAPKLPGTYAAPDNRAPAAQVFDRGAAPTVPTPATWAGQTKPMQVSGPIAGIAIENEVRSAPAFSASSPAPMAGVIDVTDTSRDAWGREFAGYYNGFPVAAPPPPR